MFFTSSSRKVAESMKRIQSYYIVKMYKTNYEIKKKTIDWSPLSKHIYNCKRLRGIRLGVRSLAIFLRVLFSTVVYNGNAILIGCEKIHFECLC